MNLEELKDNMVKCYDNGDAMLEYVSSFLEDEEFLEKISDLVLDDKEIPSQFFSIGYDIVEETMKNISNELRK